MTPAVTLRPTAGIRSLACLTILTAHVIFFAAHATEDKPTLYNIFAQQPWMNLVAHSAEPAMDTFLVLTGYYWKRAARIVPAYFSVLAIIHAAVMPLSLWPDLPAEVRRAFFEPAASLDLDACRTHWWLNLVFANNQHPVGGCYNITWSLAVQAQFYLLLPLVLLPLRPQAPGFRKRVLWACAATAVGQLCYRAAFLLTVRMWRHMPLPLMGPATAPSFPILTLAARWSYLALSARLGPFAIGVATAIAVLNPSTRQAIHRHSNKLSAATFAIFVVINAGSAKPKIGYQPDPLHPMADPAALFAAFVVLVGLVQPSLPALILLLTTTSQSGPAGAAAAFLSRPIFQKLAGISYDLYLLHPLAIFAVWAFLPPSAWFSPPQPLPFAAVACLVIALSVAAAWLHNRFWSAVLSGLGGSAVDMQVRADKP